MARCDMCFKEKTPLQAPIRGIPTVVCKGCFYEIDRVVGFLQHYGFTVSGQAALPIKPPKPPRKIPQKPRTDEKADKKEKLG